MKREGKFFFSFFLEEQKRGSTDFLFHFLVGEKYDGRYYSDSNISFLNFQS